MTSLRRISAAPRSYSICFHPHTGLHGSAQAELWDGAGNSASYWKNNLSFTAGTADIVSAAPAWTPTGAALYLRAKGVFRRETVLVWMFQ